MIVNTLTCHRHVPMAARCLGSLLKMSDVPINLVIHDDGTLTESDVSTLSRTLPGSTIRRRCEIDARVEDALAKYPLSRAFRRANPLGLKLLDPFYLDAPGVFRFCDCDILFMRPFRSLFELPNGAGAVTMRDHRQSYSIRSWKLAVTRELKLASAVNSGMLVFDRRYYDPDLIEWFLALKGLDLFPQWKEQTAWAMLARRAGADCWDRSLVRVIRQSTDLAPTLVAARFVTPSRSLLPSATVNYDCARGEVMTQPMSRCGPGVLFVDELRRKTARLLAALLWDPRPHSEAF